MCLFVKKKKFLNTPRQHESTLAGVPENPWKMARPLQMSAFPLIKLSNQSLPARVVFPPKKHNPSRPRVLHCPQLKFPLSQRKNHYGNTHLCFVRTFTALLWLGLYRVGMGDSVSGSGRFLNPWVLHFQKMGLELKCPLW
jgi:hypothetical protein